MSNNQDRVRLIAERVARRLASESTDRDRGESVRAENNSEKPRARVINFISTAAPPRTRPSVAAQDRPSTVEPATRFVPRVAQSPWLAPFARANEGELMQNPQIASHPSQERFGVEEAAVSELVEFFENEKQCSVDPSGKPCDHCAMCSARGF